MTGSGQGRIGSRSRAAGTVAVNGASRRSRSGRRKFMYFHVFSCRRPDPRENQAMDLQAVRALVDGAERVVVLTGAGISTDSGIPDFRGPQGVWTKNPAAEKTATLQYYLSDPEVRKAAWRNRMDSPAWR